MAATNLVCTNCGSHHLLIHQPDGAPDQLYAWGGQVTWVPVDDDLYAPVEDTPEMERVRCEHEVRPIREKHELRKLEGVCDRLTLSQVPCVFCGIVGGLSSNWPEDKETCPRCDKEAVRELDSYIT